MGTLIFLAGSIFFVFTIVSIVINVVKKNYAKSKRILIRALIFITIYLPLLVIFSLFSKENILSLNQDKCFDEWCVSVQNVEKRTVDSSDLYKITLKVSNKGRGRTQRPDHPHLYLQDSQGKNYETLSNEGRPLNDQIEAQTSFETYLNFELPKNAKGKLVITEGGGPTLVIIGDEQSLFHKKTVFYLH